MTTLGSRAAKPAAAPATVRTLPPAGHRRPGNILTLFMLACLVYFLLPLFWLVMAATKSNSGLFNSFGLWFGHDFDLFTNLHDVLTYNDGVYVRWLLNTLMYATVSAVGASLIAAMGGYAFAKYRFPGRNAMFAIVLGSIMVPQTVLAIPTYLLFSKIGLVNTPLAVILPSLVSPFGLYLMRVYAEGAVPDSLIEAARIDGAGPFRIFRQVAFRLLAPGIVTVLLFTLVSTWNNYFLPLIMLNNPRWYPVTVGLAQWQGQASGGSGAQALFSLVITGALLSIIPLIAAFLLLQRYWQGALGLGAVKG
ncbi:carbohydrate ABC transporter permease [Actinoallomurus sp. NPDC050550]|uniref:carbohydrate ABC transporter permease n=1 Tax=Actinoallomurus sp. NPDC050550 TaxID=3154937 RepID=UPI0033CB281E